MRYILIIVIMLFFGCSSHKLNVDNIKAGRDIHLEGSEVIIKNGKTIRSGRDTNITYEESLDVKDLSAPRDVKIIKKEFHE